MRLVNPRALAVSAVLAALVATSACGAADDPDATMKLSGNCSITETAISPKRVISEAMVEKLLGPAEWKAQPGLSISTSYTLEKAYVGNCALVSAEENETGLRISVVPKSEPQYADAQRTLASGEDVTKVDDRTYVTATSTADNDGKSVKGAKGVRIDPDIVLVVEILQPAKGVDAMKEAGTTVHAVADNLAHLG